MTRPDGTLVEPVLTSTVLEEEGSVRAVVRQKGTIGELEFTCRYHFHSGSAKVEVEFRLENPRAYGHFNGVAPGQVYFDQIALHQPLAGNPERVTTGDGSWTLAPGSTFDLRQSYDAGQAAPLDLYPGFRYQTTLNEAIVHIGERYAGAIDLSGEAGGMTATLDRFWQNHPKSLRVASGEIQIGLFPEWGHGPEYRGQYSNPTKLEDPVDPLALTNYRFEGGRWN